MPLPAVSPRVTQAARRPTTCHEENATAAGNARGSSPWVAVTLQVIEHELLDCKSVGLAFEGSNPSPATKCVKEPLTCGLAVARRLTRRLTAARHLSRARLRLPCSPRRDEPLRVRCALSWTESHSRGPQADHGHAVTGRARMHDVSSRVPTAPPSRHRRLDELGGVRSSWRQRGPGPLGSSCGSTCGRACGPFRWSGRSAGAASPPSTWPAGGAVTLLGVDLLGGPRRAACSAVARR